MKQGTPSEDMGRAQSGPRTTRKFTEVVFSKDWTRPDLPPPTPAFSWLGVMAPHVMVASLLPLVLALGLPLDALDRWPWLMRLIEPTLAAFPRLLATAKATVFPQVALVVYCSVIAGFAIVALHALITGLIVNYPRALIRYRALRFASPWQLLLYGTLNPVITLGSLYVLLMMPGDPSFAEGLTTKSRVGLGLLSSAFGVWGCGLAFGGAPTLIRLFIDVYVRRAADE